MAETSYSNISGNEIALRVALCDLVQRLKRSEFMCKYLEQCRNELASEVIRLRAHNDQIVKECASHSGNSDHNTSSSHHVSCLASQANCSFVSLFIIIIHEILCLVF
jgi:hypothetical protein